MRTKHEGHEGHTVKYYKKAMFAVHLKLKLNLKCPCVLHFVAHDDVEGEGLRLVDEVAPVPAAVRAPSGSLAPLVYSAETDTGSPVCTRE